MPVNQKRMWGFTITSVRYVFEQFFDSRNVEIVNYGNALAGRLLVSGASIPAAEMSKLDKVDPIFPVIIGVVATKK